MENELVSGTTQNGNKSSQSVHEDEKYFIHFENGLPHNTFSPSIINKLLNAEMWCFKGELHRPDGPAVVILNDELCQYEWWKHNLLDRLDGPAWVCEYKDGRKELQWWVGGVQSEHPDLCERATSPHAEEEELIALCVNEDVVVRTLALNNPTCPEEGKTYHTIMYET